MTHTELSNGTELLATQRRYKTAQEEWIKAIRKEEHLVLVHPTVAQVDKWERAHFAEEAARTRAKQAKQDYEDAIRRDLFGF